MAAIICVILGILSVTFFIASATFTSLPGSSPSNCLRPLTTLSNPPAPVNNPANAPPIPNGIIAAPTAVIPAARPINLPPLTSDSSRMLEVNPFSTVPATTLIASPILPITFPTPSRTVLIAVPILLAALPIPSRTVLIAVPILLAMLPIPSNTDLVILPNDSNPGLAISNALAIPIIANVTAPNPTNVIGLAMLANPPAIPLSNPLMPSPAPCPSPANPLPKPPRPSVSFAPTLPPMPSAALPAEPAALPAEPAAFPAAVCPAPAAFSAIVPAAPVATVVAGDFFIIANNGNTCRIAAPIPSNGATQGGIDAPATPNFASSATDPSMLLIVSSIALPNLSKFFVAISSNLTENFCADCCASTIPSLPLPPFASFIFFLDSSIFSLLYCRLCFNDSACDLAISAYSPPSAMPALPIVPALSMVLFPIWSAYFELASVTASAVSLSCLSKFARCSFFSRCPDTVAS